MRKIVWLLVFLPLLAQAQWRMPCVQDLSLPELPFSKDRHHTRLSSLKTKWDANRVYRQAVILIIYSDCDFTMPDPQAHYDSLFNVKGYRTELGEGCVAEYFRDQSNGLFNLQFDVYGPVKIAKNVKSDQYNEGRENCRLAMRKAVDSLTIDFKPYDWDEDGLIDQMVFVSASYAANGGQSDFVGYTWPSTGTFTGVATKDGLIANTYSVSCERWYTGRYTGIGTICHEYSHCLGLPDYYPTMGSAAFSVVDEWSLMDGGNYTGWGDCPPNYSASDKYLLGWLTPKEITGPMQVRGLKPVADGGEAYIMKVSENEFYMLENRQRGQWDRGLPGTGLLITYTHFNSSTWQNNTVNASLPFLYDIVHASGWDYNTWEDYLINNAMSAHSSYEDNDHRLRNLALSTSAYPLVNDTMEVRRCDTLPFAISHIEMESDGLLSFDIENATGIEGVQERVKDASPDVWYDLQGRRLEGRPQRTGLYINSGKLVHLRNHR